MISDIEALRPLYEAHIDRLCRGASEILERRGLSALVISAGAPAPVSRFDDQDHPFRPTPAFSHWIPLREPYSALVLRPGERPVLVRARPEGFWNAAPRVESHHMWSAFDVVETSADGVLAEIPRPARAAFVGDDPDRAAAWGFGGAATNPEGVIADLHELRTKKSEYELVCLREANRAAAAGHARLAESFAAEDRSELSLHLRYLRTTGQDDPDTPYKNIVATGENAATLHHVAYARAGRGPEPTSLLVDAGATCLGYASDITRTWVKGKSAAAETFAELIRRVDALQSRITAEIEPGRSFEALHDRAHELLAGVLRDVGIARADPQSLVDAGATRAFFPHGLGHALGVQVHDVGHRPRPPREENPFLRNTRAVEIGHVFTIEPGCYFIPSLLDDLRGRPIAADINWPVVDALRPFGGVRIEDDIAVTDDGVENLTRPALERAGCPPSARSPAPAQ